MTGLGLALFMLGASADNPTVMAIMTLTGLYLLVRQAKKEGMWIK